MTTQTTRMAALAAALLFGTAGFAITASAADTNPPADTNAPAAPAETTAPAAPEKAMPAGKHTHAKHAMKHGMKHAPKHAMKHGGAHHHMAAKGSKTVSDAQEALNKEGASLKVDGKSGPQTRAALKSFQKAHGLKATGKLDKATKEALKLG